VGESLLHGWADRWGVFGELPLSARVRIGRASDVGPEFGTALGRAGWSSGYHSAYARMLEEATALGAHGVIGVVDRVTQVSDSQTSEFHFLGTAVTVDDGPPPAGGTPWTTYLAGQRLTKSIEAGFMRLPSWPRWHRYGSGPTASRNT